MYIEVTYETKTGEKKVKGYPDVDEYNLVTQDVVAIINTILASDEVNNMTRVIDLDIYEDEEDE